MSYLLQVDAFVDGESKIISEDVATRDELFDRINELVNKHFVRCVKITCNPGVDEQDIIISFDSFEQFDNFRNNAHHHLTKIFAEEK